MAKEHIIRAQKLLGTEETGDFEQPDLESLISVLDLARVTAVSGTASTAKGLSLGERALAFALSEAKKYGNSPVPDARVAEYFETCERHGARIGADIGKRRLRGERMAFCAAAFGYCERSVAYAGEVLPPHRAGALEVQRDAENMLRPGERWVDISSVRSGYIIPPPGSALVYDRGLPGQGFGHIERGIFFDKNALGFRAIGFNENSSRIVVDDKLQSYANPQLRGVIIPR